MTQRRLSEESVYTNGGILGPHDDSDLPHFRLTSSSPNDISAVVAGVQPATLAVLNPLRPSAGARTTSSRGKPATAITTSTLPVVTKADFQLYLNEISPEWTRSQRSRALGTKGTPAVAGQQEGETGRNNRLANSTSSRLPPLDVVPAIYQDENFDLANPIVFEEVTSREEQGLAKGTATLGDLATDQILQEKLSHYLDVVELHLTREISVRSASFFAALANLQSLRAQSAQALDRVSALRTELVEIDQRSAVTGLAAVRAGLKRRRLEGVTRGVERLRELERAIGQATQLADAGEWEGALGLVEEVEGAIAPDTTTPSPARVQPDALGISSIPEEDEMEGGPSSPSEPKLQLHKLKALRGVPDRLGRLRQQVAHALETEVVAVLSHELEDAVVVYRRSTATTPAAWDPEQRAKAKQKAETRLRPLVRGLSRCGWPSVESVVSSWRNALSRDIRLLVRADLPATANDTEEALNDVDGPQTTSNKSAALGQALRAQSHETFMQLLRSTCSRLAAAVDVAALHQTVLLELVDAQTPPPNADARAGLALELADTVHGAAELANLRFSKIVGVRGEVHAALALRDFAEVFHEAWAFVVQCEVACQRMIVGLRGVLVGQAKAFLQSFHGAKVSASAQLVEVEQWSPADVPASAQSIVEEIISAAVKDPKSFMLSATDAQPATNAANGPTAKYLVIEERNYFAVVACLKTLDSLADYLRVVLNLPLLATDAMSRIIEFLKQFNSRTCQVVLGAGAMRSAGLKNITAKHLALASQSLSIMIALIPYVREALRRHLSAKQAVMLTEFDKLKRDYQEHQYEIHAKLVAIMNDRLAVHCRSLQAIDWNADNPKGVNAYMETLIKETATLHKVLAKYLHGPTLDQVIGQVLADVNARLAEEYGKIELRDLDAKGRLLSDARFLQTKLAELKGLTRPTPGQELVNLVDSKPTMILPPRPATPPKPVPEPAPAKSAPEPGPVVAAKPEVPVAAAAAVNTEEPSAVSPTLPTSAPPSSAPAAPVQVQSVPTIIAPTSDESFRPVSAAEAARAPATSGVKNRLAGLFGKPRPVSTTPSPASSTAASPILDAGRSSMESLRSFMQPRSPLTSTSAVMTGTEASASPPLPTIAARDSMEGRQSLEKARDGEVDAELEKAAEVLAMPEPTPLEAVLPEEVQPSSPLPPLPEAPLDEDAQLMAPSSPARQSQDDAPTVATDADAEPLPSDPTSDAAPPAGFEASAESEGSQQAVEAEAIVPPVMNGEVASEADGPSEAIAVDTGNEAGGRPEATAANDDVG